MNPVAEQIATTSFPSMAEVRKTLKIRWYRCPIDTESLRQLTRPCDIQGLVQALGHLMLWVITGVTAYTLYSQQIWWAFFLALFAHGTVASFFTAPNHELCHKTVFKTRGLNDFFLGVYGLIGAQNFRIYQFSHHHHHRYTLFLEGDREEVMPATPSLRALYMLQLFTVNITGGYQSRGLIPTIKGHIKIARNQFDNPFNSWGEELYEGHDKQREMAVNWARAVLIFHGLVIVGALAIGQPILIVLISGSIFIGNWWRYFVGVPMHCGLRTNNADFRKCVRTIKLDPLSQFLYWHMNWHLEHHMFAAVPCYYLEKLHHAVADDMPEPRTLVGAWKEMRETWKRQCIDPDYAFDTPVPSKAVKNTVAEADSLASSMGELGPRELTQ